MRMAMGAGIVLPEEILWRLLAKPATCLWWETGMGMGHAKIGIFRNGLWVLDSNGNGQYDPGGDLQFYFGQAGDVPVVGDWNHDGRAKVGIFRNGLWAIDTIGVHNSSDPSTTYSYFGQQGDIPVLGD